MVRLRMININPDFGTTSARLSALDMPSMPSLAHLPFDERYLVEALLSHSRVMVPEVSQLLKAVERCRYPHRTLVLEGLFKWTRRGDIAEDVTRMGLIRLVGPANLTVQTSPDVS